jgi:hypothetical protein
VISKVFSLNMELLTKFRYTYTLGYQMNDPFAIN